MREVSSDVSLLAPVPLVHLEDGANVCAQQGKVAFGSRAWELFRQLDELRHGLAIDVYIYASQVPGSPAEVSWHGRYIGHVESKGGTHPLGMQFRPPSTGRHPSDNKGHWAVFWEVENLSRLLEPIPIADLQGLGKAKPYGRGFVPEGPVLIEHP